MILTDAELWRKESPETAGLPFEVSTKVRRPLGEPNLVLRQGSLQPQEGRIGARETMDLLSSLVSETPRHLIVSVYCSCGSIAGARVQCGAGFLRSILELSVIIAAFNILYLAASSLNSRRNYFPGTRLAL